jgi:hypothetical protein
MVEPRHLTALWAFIACYRDSFTFAMIGTDWKEEKKRQAEFQ